MAEIPSSPPDQDNEWLNVPPLRYPIAYLIFVAFSSADILLTWIIIRQGGDEVNPIAKTVIDAWGLPGAIGFKFALTLFIIVSCEVIGRKRERWARLLIRAAVIIAALPPVYSVLLLITHHWLGPY